MQAVTITAPVNTVTSGGSGSSSGQDTSGTSAGGLSSGAKLGIGLGAGLGGGLALLGLLGFLLWRRRKARVGDDFKWPELGDGTGSGGTAAGLYPNPTHPTGNNRFDMDDEDLFDGANGGSNGASQMMSEREPSFLSSAAGSAGGGGYASNPAYGGLAGLGAGGAAAAGLGAAAASSQGHSRYPTQSDMGGDYYSQDGHSNMNGYSPDGAQGNPYSNYPSYENAPQQYGQQPYYGGGGNPGAGIGAGAAAAGLPAGAAGLGRTGSIASTTAGGYQVGNMPDDRQRRNRLSVVNNLGDVGEE